MAKSAPSITSFNAGEFSPLMAARSDLKYYQNACKKIQNFIPTVQGPARNRSGTKFVREVKDSANRTWLRRFVFSKSEAYIIEFGDLYVRFYTDHGVIESSPGVPYEIATPFTTASLTRSDGTFRLRFVQSGDVLYITSDGQYPVQKLVRLSATTFSIAALETTGGPFLDIDPDNPIVMYASAATGNGITVTANADVFTANHVGALIFMEQKKADGVTAWESGKAIAVGNVRRSDGKNYQALNAATTGGVKPIHSHGSRYDGDTGVSWDFLEPGYGWVKITGFTSTTVVSADVLSRLPAGAVGAANPTPRWAFSAFNAVEGYPDNVAFFRERLCFSKFLNLYMSVSSDYENFSRYDDGGLVTADMAIVSEIAGEEANNIVWMAGMTGALLIGTAGEEFAISELTSSQAFGPGNVKVSRQTKHGSSYGGEVVVGEEIVFVQAAGRKVRSLAQAESVDVRWASADLTVLAEHVTASGVTAMAYQQEPDSIIWCMKNDGALVGFTMNKEQDVRGWHPHQIGGESDTYGERAIVESIDVIPANGYDELWMIVRRLINGATKRYVEYLTPQRNPCDDYEDAFYVDSGVTAANTQTADLTPGTGATTAGRDVLFTATGAFPGCPAVATTTSGTLNDVGWDGSMFLTVGGDGMAFDSPDGLGWTQRSLPNGASAFHNAVVWNETLWVVVGGSGSVPSSIYTSPDGIAWTTQTSGSSQLLSGIVWNGSVFVIVGNLGTVITSPDGITWTSRTSGVGDSLSDVMWNGSVFIAVGSGVIITSPDGITWTTRVSGSGIGYFGVAWNGSIFITVGGSGTILTSPDGITWTSRTSGTANTLNDVVWNGSILTVVGAGGTILTSPDGITWTSRTSGTANALNGITWNGSMFVAVGASGTILTSYDGITWQLSNFIVSSPPSVGLKIQHRYKRSSVACTDISWGKGVAVVTGCVDQNRVIATIDSGFPDTNVVSGPNWTLTAETVSGLGHLEGEVVSVAADGVAQAQQVVSGGAITLAAPAAKVHVGLPYRSLITPMPIEAGAADGTAQGKTKRISRCIIRFIASLGAKFGRSGTGQLDPIPSAAELRKTMDTPADLFSGDVVVAWPDGYDNEALITVVQDDPLPCTVAGLFPQMNTQDNR